MFELKTLWLATVFACPQGLTLQEPFCGAAVEVNGPYTSSTQCRDRALAGPWVGVPNTLVICRPVGAGTQKRVKGEDREKFILSSKTLCKAPTTIVGVRPAGTGYWFRCG